MNEIKLKPCPFCGGKGVLNNEKDRIFSFVKCEQCGAESGLIHVSAEYCADGIAIENWNRRIRVESIALKPDIYGDGYDDNGNIIYDTYDCPNCEASYELDYEKHDYCPSCGQKFDWES
ncbi:MAG: Lar family restriction alleviation protein [Ruminococcus flavefaciens]|nr:Lar family restriction alleviation protein [Ruminococcus flavefaciens]MCM1060588.1 Lar family restriction alleviation protein [Eubacterium sp.]